MARATPVNSGYTIINGSTTGSNGSKVNTWLEYKVLSQSIANNTSTVRVILYSQATISSSTQQTGTARQYGYVQAGASSSTKYYLSTTFTYENYNLNKFADHTFTVSHEVNGTKSIRLAGAFDISAYVGQYITGGSASATVTLPTIPQHATVTQTVQSKTETSITMTWTSDNVIDYVKYSINNGTSWVNVGAVNSTTGSYTISGLTVNTTYQIKTQVRNKSSQLTTDSSASSVATYNYPYATVTPDFTIGNAVKVTFYNPLGRTFSFGLVANGQQISYESWTISGTSYNGFNGSGTVSNLYASIPSAKNGQYYVKTTYNGHTITSSVHGTYSANASVCKPSITSLTYADTNSTTTAITLNNQNIVQNRSTVRYTATGVTGNYSATISSVSVAVNNASYTLSKSGDNYIGGNATIDSGQNVTAICTVTDSRGFTATKSVTVTMLSWVLPSAIISLNRQNNFYSETDITVDASYSSIDGKNTISISYQARIQGTETWTITGTLQDNVQSTFVADNQYAWEVQIILTDALGGTTTYNAVIQRGMPLIFFDRLKTSVGINCFPSSNDSLWNNGYDLDYNDGSVTHSSGWEVYSGATPVVKRQGQTCYLNGVINPTGNVTLDATGVDVGQIDDAEFYPSETVFILCQGSGTSFFFLRVKTDGKIHLERLRDVGNANGVYTQGTSSMWFPFSVSWIK